jgi:hypothetical protein
MVSLNFKRSEYDLCVYFKNLENGMFIILVLYVDDMCCNNIEILAFGNLGEKNIVVFNYRKCRYEKMTICLSRASLNVLYLSSSVK